MSEMPIADRSAAQRPTKSLWPMAAAILFLVFAPAAVACAFTLLHH